MSVLTTYLQAVGYKFVFLIMFLYWLDLVGSTAASFWLTRWTSDTDLQNLTLLPADSEERYSNNIYYLSVYGWLGLLQGNCTKLTIKSYFNFYYNISLCCTRDVQKVIMHPATHSYAARIRTS